MSARLEKASPYGLQSTLCSLSSERNVQLRPQARWATIRVSRCGASKPGERLPLCTPHHLSTLATVPTGRGSATAPWPRAFRARSHGAWQRCARRASRATAPPASAKSRAALRRSRASPRERPPRPRAPSWALTVMSTHQSPPCLRLRSPPTRWPSSSRVRRGGGEAPLLHP